MLSRSNDILVDLEVNEIGSAVVDGFDAPVPQQILLIPIGLWDAQ